MSVVSIVHQNLYLSTWTKYTTTVIPGIVSETIFCVGYKLMLFCDMHKVF